ncbi:hypothetical protein QYE76_001698 [Lolium multiflorum]|uniref:Uncharacterized protein n=1 Tax=Lolium multiflorum TaxID=4521 RepID=A0AAD8RLU9_LOLMU|nr:hypothetical protein QYE76_001698 [Lolium multiflorum]
MSAVVTKSVPVVVFPSEPAGGGNINLSSVDECHAGLPVTSLLVFDNPIVDPVETIKRALSEALVHYRPIAGRLADEGGALRIACTGEGVSFVGASASGNLPPTSATLQIKDIALQYPADLCRHSDPLLLMQVTEFSCGGFTVAATWNHAVADGKGMAQFLQAVGELGRGMPTPSVLPVRSCEEAGSLPVVPASAVAMHRAVMNLANKNLVALDVTVPWSLIRRIKVEYGCTVFEAVAAVLWRCRTRAVITDPEAAAPLSFACNLRKHLGTKDGYYGNCFTQPLVYAAAGTVANCEIGDLVNLIKCAKEKVLLDTSNGECESERQGSTPTVDQIKNLLYNILAVGSWRNLGFDGADFGHGSPSRVVWHMEQVAGPCCIACPPCKGKDGVNVVSLCVKPEHVDAFLAELASM